MFSSRGETPARYLGGVRASALAAAASNWAAAARGAAVVPTSLRPALLRLHTLMVVMMLTSTATSAPHTMGRISRK